MYESIIEKYKTAFPNQQGKRDSGYILPDGYVVDISDEGPLYCHGSEFFRKEALVEWVSEHRDLGIRPRSIADAIMDDIGGIEFTINNMNLQCVRLPQKPLTAAQRVPLREIISRILEKGFIRIEILSTREYAEYDAAKNSVDAILNKIDNYYAHGHLPNSNAA